MPLGASTVFGVGSSDGNGFRKLVRDQARFAGYEVNMVGTKNGGTMKDNDCEATSGHIVTEAHEASRLSYKFKPNVVIMNIGTNDCIHGIDNGNQHNRLRAMIEAMWRNISPDTVMIVSTLLPLEGQGGVNRNNVNNLYRQMVADLAAQGRPIYIADMDHIPMSDVPDKVHPHDGGFRKMAAAFWAGIQAAERDGKIKAPLPMEGNAEGDTGTCKKPAGNGVWAGGLTQRGSGEHDGIYRHRSQPEGVVLTITSDFDRNQWRFARLFRSDRDDLVGWFDLASGEARYGVWRNDGGGKFTKINDLSVQDNCIPRGIVFIDLNGDGLDDFACIGRDGAVFASINRGNGGGATPPTFRHIGLWKAAQPGYPQAQVRLADIDGDGRADFCGLSLNGDISCWRNGGIQDKPAYWQALGRRFTGKGMGDLAGVRFEDLNGDGRDDWLWVDGNGQTTTWTNARSCLKGVEGDGLNVAWRQGFNGNANSGPTHPGGFGGSENIRNRIHFARIFGVPQDFGLLGRLDYVYMEHAKEGNKHKFSVRVYRNLGSGGTKLVADGNKYCDMTGNGRDDYVWTHSKGIMTMFPNGGKNFLTGSESYWGPSARIFDAKQVAGRELDRRDLHLADWDGDGKCDIIYVDAANENRVTVFRNLDGGAGGNWRWQNLGNPAPALRCPEKRGIGLHDLAVRFADISGSGRPDYLCIEKDGRIWGWTQSSNGAWTHVPQFKSAKGHDRANLRFHDVDGDGRADTIWVEKFSGDGFVYYNLGRRDIGGSQYWWEQKPGGGPFHAYAGSQAGTCMYYPDLDGNGRADMHGIKGTWTNEAETWYNMCSGDAKGDDPGGISNPNLPPQPLPPNPGTGTGPAPAPSPGPSNPEIRDLWGTLPACRDTSPHDTLEKLENDGSIPAYCLPLYALEVLRRMAARSLDHYERLMNSNYDRAFGHFRRAVHASADTNLEEWILPRASSYFECTTSSIRMCCWQCTTSSCRENCIPDGSTLVCGSRETKPSECPPQRTVDVLTTGNVTFSLREDRREAFYRDVFEGTGLAEEHIRFGRYMYKAHLPGQTHEKCSQTITNCQRNYYLDFPVVNYDQFRIDTIPNPKDVVEPAVGKADSDLPATLWGYEWGFKLGLIQEDISEVVDALTVPVIMVGESVDAMQKAYDIGEEVREEETKNLILLVVETVLFIVPFLGKLAGTIGATATFVRAAANLVGDLGLISVDIYKITQATSDEDRVALAIGIGITGMGALTNIPSMRAAGQLRKATRADTIRRITQNQDAIRSRALMQKAQGTCPRYA
ncbi:SGNH-hydro domain-containing protein [Fusarium sp. LHS14.1]|nr:SGNH-hydro domain-containing protein [Fusarium sp. LHS14.1]